MIVMIFQYTVLHPLKFQRVTNTVSISSDVHIVLDVAEKDTI